MLNINSAIYNAQGIDVNNVNRVSSQIIKEASKTEIPNVQTIDYSKFNRAVLGIDLYSSRTNTDVQKQVAMTQAGLYAKSIDVAQLNSKAAMSLYSASTVQKNVELAQSSASQELIAPQKLETQTSKIQIFNTQDKNENSSNGFNPFNANEKKDSKNESEKDIFNLFA